MKTIISGFLLLLLYSLVYSESPPEAEDTTEYDALQKFIYDLVHNYHDNPGSPPPSPPPLLVNQNNDITPKTEEIKDTTPVTKTLLNNNTTKPTKKSNAIKETKDSNDAKKLKASELVPNSEADSRKSQIRDIKTDLKADKTVDENTNKIKEILPENNTDKQSRKSRMLTEENELDNQNTSRNLLVGNTTPNSNIGKQPKKSNVIEEKKDLNDTKKRLPDKYKSQNGDLNSDLDVKDQTKADKTVSEDIKQIEDLRLENNGDRQSRKSRMLTEENEVKESTPYSNTDKQTKKSNVIEDKKDSNDAKKRISDNMKKSEMVPDNELSSRKSRTQVGDLNSEDNTAGENIKQIKGVLPESIADKRSRKSEMLAEEKELKELEDFKTDLVRINEVISNIIEIESVMPTPEILPESSVGKISKKPKKEFEDADINKIGQATKTTQMNQPADSVKERSKKSKMMIEEIEMKQLEDIKTDIVAINEAMSDIREIENKLPTTEMLQESNAEKKSRRTNSNGNSNLKDQAKFDNNMQTPEILPDNIAEKKAKKSKKGNDIDAKNISDDAVNTLSTQKILPENNADNLSRKSKPQTEEIQSMIDINTDLNSIVQVLTDITESKTPPSETLLDSDSSKRSRKLKKPIEDIKTDIVIIEEAMSDIKEKSENIIILETLQEDDTDKQAKKSKVLTEEVEKKNLKKSDSVSDDDKEHNHIEIVDSNVSNIAETQQREKPFSYLNQFLKKSMEIYQMGSMMTRSFLPGIFGLPKISAPMYTSNTVLDVMNPTTVPENTNSRKGRKNLGLEPVNL